MLAELDYQLSHSLSSKIGALNAYKQALLLVLKSLYLSFHPSQWPAHLLVQHSQLERTSKHANYVNHSIIFQPNFEPVYTLTTRVEPFDLYIVCRAIHGLSVHIYSAPEQVSQLLKILIENFLSFKTVCCAYHLLF